jgi:hypothetical protein
MNPLIRIAVLILCLIVPQILPAQIFDFPPQNFWRLSYIGEIGGFSEISGASIDPFGNVFVSDRGTHMIHRIARTGLIEQSIGGYGWGNQEFDRPSGIWAENGVDVYIADYGNHRIQRFDRRLTYIASLETRVTGFEIERFGYPVAVMLNRQGDLYIADEENLRIVCFSSFDRHVRTFGGFDAGRFRIGQPKRIQIFLDDMIVVQDGKRLLFFDQFGNPYREFPSRLLPEYKDFAIFGSDIFLLQDESVDIYRGEFTRPFERIMLYEYMPEPETVQRIAVSSNRIVLMTEDRLWMFQLLK